MDEEPTEEVPPTQKRQELPYVEVLPLKEVAHAAMQTAKRTAHEKSPQAYKSRAPVEEEVDIEKLEVFTVPHVFGAECAEFRGVRTDPRGILTSQLPIICCATIRMDPHGQTRNPHISRGLRGNRPSASEHGNSDCKDCPRPSASPPSPLRHIKTRLPRHAVT